MERDETMWFHPFLFTIKNGGNVMKEYKRILLPLQKEKILVIAAVCSGFFAAILNLSRPLFMGLIVDSLIQRELKGAYLYIALFAGSRLMMWINNLSFDYVAQKQVSEYYERSV